MSESNAGVPQAMLTKQRIDADAEYRKAELRIQALGAAVSRRDWHAVEQAYAAIRDGFYSHGLKL